MKEEKRGFHPVRWIKERIKKIGTLNLILILVGAFFIWFNAQMLNIFRMYGAIPESSHNRRMRYMRLDKDHKG